MRRIMVVLGGAAFGIWLTRFEFAPFNGQWNEVAILLVMAALLVWHIRRLFKQRGWRWPRND